MYSTFESACCCLFIAPVHLTLYSWLQTLMESSVHNNIMVFGQKNAVLVSVAECFPEKLVWCLVEQDGQGINIRIALVLE